MSKRKKLLTKYVLCAVMAASVVSFSGTALAEDGVEYGSVHVLENGTVLIDGQVSPEQITSIKGGSITVEDKDAQNAGENGISAIQVKGGSLTVEDMDITGAVSVRNGGTLTINNSTATVGSYYYVDDNNVKKEGGTDFKTEGGTFTVNDSVIHSLVYAAESDDGKHMKGVLTFNNSDIDTSASGKEKGSIVADYNSTIILNGNENNTYKVGNFLAALTDENFQNPGRIEINGGTLIADNLRKLMDGSILLDEALNGEGDLKQKDVEDLQNHTVKGGIVLKDNGVIQTKTGQIFEYGIDTTSDETALASTDSGKVTNDYISYEGGTINFTDERYTLAYLDSAKENMALVGEANINMLGKLVNEDGENINLSVEEAVEHVGETGTTATVEADKDITKLVVGKGETDDSVQYSNGSFAAGKLLLGENTSAIEITDGKSLGLNGTDDGDLITGNKGDLDITVNSTDSKLTLGKKDMPSSDNSLTANVTVNSGTLEAVSGNTVVDGNITLNSGNFNVNGDATLTVNKTLTAQQDVNINIGDKDSAGTLKAQDTQLNGATIYLDPVWKDGQTIGEASKAGIVFAEETGVDGSLIVGENSVLTLGSTDTNLAEEAFNKTEHIWGDGEDEVLSAVYVASPQDISNGSLLVDKTAAGTEVLQKGEVNFGKNSILIVDGKNLNEDEAAIQGVTSAQIAQNEADKQNGAKLYIDNAEAGKKYTILDLTDGTEQWNADNVTSNNTLMIFGKEQSEEDQTNYYTVTDYKNVEDELGDGVVAANVINDTLQSDIKSGNIDNAAFKFFNKAVDTNNNRTDEAQITALNSVANMGELAGVNHGAYSMSNTMTDAVADHLSLANHGEQDNDIWARYIHSEEDIEDMELGGINADYDATYNGIIVGGDFYKNGKGTIGLAVSYADGDIDGSNMASRTENDAEYYGASLYGRIDNGDSALLGDISFLHGSNDITQYNSGEKITASPDADAFSVGLRAEKEIKAGNGKFVPYMGVRYMHLGTGDYTNSLGMKYNADDQNLFLLPVGLKYTAEIKHNDWTVKPMAEVGYVWNFGDKDTDQTVSLNGVSDTFGFDTVDDGAFIGRLGIEAESDKMAYGIGYEYQNGDSSSSDKWMANVIFKF